MMEYLTQPLTPADEWMLIQAAQQANTSAKERLLLAHRRFIYSLVLKFHTTPSLHEELFQAGCIGLLQAIEHFDPNAGVRLLSYAASWIIGEMKKLLKEELAQSTYLFYEQLMGEPYLSRKSTETVLITDYARLDLQIALEKLNAEERTLIYLRFFRDKTQKETALLLSRSQSQISKLESKILDQLRMLLT